MRVRTLIVKQISGDLTGRIGYPMALSPRALSTATSPVTSPSSSPRNSYAEDEPVEFFTHDNKAVLCESETSRETVVLSTGTFDPPHKAHVKSIEMMREEFGVDQIIVSAVFDPVHKAGRGLKDTHHHRSQMVKVAVEDIERVSVDVRPFTSTAQALARLHAEHPYETRIFIMGMDLLESFPTWDGGPERYLRHAHIVVIPRPGYSVPDSEAVRAVLERYGAESIDQLRMEEAGRILLWQEPSKTEEEDISSTSVRKIYGERGANHHSLSNLLPPKVAQYIADNKLYVVKKPADKPENAPIPINRSLVLAPSARLFNSYSRLALEHELAAKKLDDDKTLNSRFNK